MACSASVVSGYGEPQTEAEAELTIRSWIAPRRIAIAIRRTAWPQFHFREAISPIAKPTEPSGIRTLTNARYSLETIELEKTPISNERACVADRRSRDHYFCKLLYPWIIVAHSLGSGLSF